MRPRDAVKYPPLSIEEGLALVKLAMKRAGMIGSTTPAQARAIVLESTLADEIEKITLTTGFPKKPVIPKAWGWPASWIDALFYGEKEAVGVQIYNEKEKTWHIIAVKGGAMMVDSRTGQPICFDSPQDAKFNIDSYNSKMRNQRIR